jgi:hypothetical protein
VGSGARIATIGKLAVGRLEILQVDPIAFAARGALQCDQVGKRAQSDALGQQLIRIASGVPNQPIATPLLAGRYIIPSTLGNSSPVTGLCQAGWSRSIQHPSENRRAADDRP